MVCALQNPFKIKLMGDILMVIIHNKFCRNPFINLELSCLQTDRKTYRSENITSFIYAEVTTDPHLFLSMSHMTFTMLCLPWKDESASALIWRSTSVQATRRVRGGECVYKARERWRYTSALFSCKLLYRASTLLPVEQDHKTYQSYAIM